MTVVIGRRHYILWNKLQKIFDDGILKSGDKAQMLYIRGMEPSIQAKTKSITRMFLVSSRMLTVTSLLKRRTPVFNGANILKGMKVKHTMYVTVENTL